MTDTATSQALRKSSVARYLQLATLFRRRIETGEWSVGSQIPTVENLAQECGVATMTIRQALNILETDGLIERFRAKGTFVRTQPKKDLWCEVQTDWSGLLIARQDATIEILHQQRHVPLPPFEGVTGVVATAYRHLKRRHSRGGTAFLLADVYLNEDVAKLIPEQAYTTMTAMRLVSDLPGHKIDNAWQQLTIGSADLETSTLLNMPLGEPVAKVQRVAVDEHGEVVLVANGIYRGDKVRIDMKLR